MARASIWLPKFDPCAEYVVRRQVVVSGAVLRRGDRFDKSTVTTRRLRCLYEARKIELAPYRPNGSANGHGHGAATDRDGRTDGQSGPPVSDSARAASGQRDDDKSNQRPRQGRERRGGRFTSMLRSGA